MYSHYIKIDEKSRIIDGFTTAQHAPDEGDIKLKDSPNPNFELFDKMPFIPLSINSAGGALWLYLYENGKVRSRTKAELREDLPPRPPKEPADKRLDDAEADIKTLSATVLIIMGEIP